MEIVPTRTVQQQMDRLGISWAQVVAEVTCPQSVQPIVGHDTRMRYIGKELQVYVEPGTIAEEPALFLVGLRTRERAERPAEEQIVGRDTAGPRASRRGGAGSSWPSTFRELIARIRAVPGCEVVYGTKHHIVKRDGHKVYVLPVSASDHRSLKNACLALRRVGIDVSRRSVLSRKAG